MPCFAAGGGQPFGFLGRADPDPGRTPCGRSVCRDPSVPAVLMSVRDRSRRGRGETRLDDDDGDANDTLRRVHARAYARRFSVLPGDFARSDRATGLIRRIYVESMAAVAVRPMSSSLARSLGTRRGKASLSVNAGRVFRFARTCVPTVRSP